MKYEYKTTFNNVQWESRKPRNSKVVEPDGEGWEMVGFCVENTGDRTSILWWTWKREKQPESDCQF